MIGVLAFLLTFSILNTAHAQTPPPGTAHDGKAFSFTPIRAGVFYVKGTGSLSAGCNTTLIVGRDDALLVDSHISPPAIYVLMEEMKTVTDKPVRYVVNTHFHFDHAHGNQMFPDDVEIVGHTFTRDMIAAGNSKSGRSYNLFIGGLPGQIADLEKRLAEAKTDSARIVLQRQLSIQRTYKTATDAVTPRAPNRAFDRRLDLTMPGGRTVQVLFFGRGHTGGDVVVYLPEEKALVTGDLMTAGLSYIGDGYIEEWIETLEKVKTLDFTVILPGDGDPFEDRSRIDHFQAYLRDFWEKAKTMHAAGIPAEKAALQIDMTAHKPRFPSITGPGVNLHAVLRAYELIEEKAK